MSEVKVKIEVDAKQGVAATKELGDTAGYTTDKLGLLRDAAGKFVKTGTEIGGAANAASKPVSAFSRILDSTIGQFTLAGVASNAITGGVVRIQQAFADAVATGARFQSGLNELSAITGIAGADLSALGDAALENARETGVAIDQQLEAYKLLASNIDITTIGGVEGLKKLQKEVITLTQASGVDLATASNTVAASLNQFGLQGDDAARVVNVLAAGSKYGAAEVADLAMSMKESGTTAALAGQSIETTVAAIEVLSQNALKGSEAGTGLRNVLTILNTEADKLAKAGIADVNLQTDGLAGTLVKLQPLLGDASAMVDIFGRENLNAAQILIKNATAVTEMERRVTGTNIAMEQATIQTQGFEAAQRRLSAAWQATAASWFTGLEPAMTGILNLTASLLTPTESLISKQERLTTAAGNLEKNVAPLVEEYETLKGKTNLSNIEQDRMKTILEELKGVMPDAVIEWDKYGTAVGLNTKAAQDFIKQQKEIALFAQRDAIQQNISQLDLLAKSFERLAVQQQKVQAAGGKLPLAQPLATAGAVVAAPRFLGIEEVNKNLNETRNKALQLINQLRVLGIELDDVANLRELGITLPAGLDLKQVAADLGFVESKTEAAGAAAEGAGKKGKKGFDDAAKSVEPLTTKIKTLTQKLEELTGKAEFSEGDLKLASQLRSELSEAQDVLESRLAAMQTALDTFEISDFEMPVLDEAITDQELSVDIDLNPIMTGWEELDKKLKGYVAGLQAGSILTNALSSYASAANAARIASIEKEEAAVLKRYDTEEQRIRRSNDSKLKDIDRELASATLSEQQRTALMQQRLQIESGYEIALEENARKKAAAQEQADARIRAAKKKAAEQEKKWAIANAVMQGAVAIIEALPNPLLATATALAVGLQVAAIRKQPIPEFAAGGRIPVKVSNGEYYVPPAIAAANLPMLELINAGMIKGPGSGTSDSIAALAQPGGYVINARSAGASKSVLDSISRGYALGGFISNSAPVTVSPAAVNLDPLIYELRALRLDFERMKLAVHGRELKLLLDRETAYQANQFGV